VMRQIDYLSPDFDLTVIGPRPPVSGWENVTFSRSPDQHWPPSCRMPCSICSADLRRPGTTGGSGAPALPGGVQTSIGERADAIHATTGKRYHRSRSSASHRARVVFHQHEFAELEREYEPLFRWILSRGIRYTLAKYTS